jgi:hypothetical protein
MKGIFLVALAKGLEHHNRSIISILQIRAASQTVVRRLPKDFEHPFTGSPSPRLMTTPQFLNH